MSRSQRRMLYNLMNYSRKSIHVRTTHNTTSICRCVLGGQQCGDPVSHFLGLNCLIVIHSSRVTGIHFTMNCEIFSGCCGLPQSTLGVANSGREAGGVSWCIAPLFGGENVAQRDDTSATVLFVHSGRRLVRRSLNRETGLRKAHGRARRVMSEWSLELHALGVEFGRRFHCIASISSDDDSRFLRPRPGAEVEGMRWAFG